MGKLNNISPFVYGRTDKVGYRILSSPFQLEQKTVDIKNFIEGNLTNSSISFYEKETQFRWIILKYGNQIIIGVISLSIYFSDKVNKCNNNKRPFTVFLGYVFPSDENISNLPLSVDLYKPLYNEVILKWNENVRSLPTTNKKYDIEWSKHEISNSENIEVTLVDNTTLVYPNRYNEYIWQQILDKKPNKDFSVCLNFEKLNTTKNTDLNIISISDKNFKHDEIPFCYSKITKDETKGKLKQVFQEEEKNDSRKIKQTLKEKLESKIIKIVGTLGVLGSAVIGFVYKSPKFIIISGSLTAILAAREFLIKKQNVNSYE